MGVLRVDHPDVEDFIACKINENQITNFNISVGITDAFMRAVKNDEEWELRFPDLSESEGTRFRRHARTSRSRRHYNSNL